MPRSQAVLHFDVFEGLDGCTDDEKLLYFALLTEQTVNQAGVGALRLTLWARRLRHSVERVAAALAGLDARRFVFVDQNTEEILIRTLIRRDGVAGQPNLLWAAVRQAPLTRSPRLRLELAAELRRLPAQRPDTITKTGRRFVHADPHAIADTLDPPPPSPMDNFPESGDSPVDNQGGEPFQNPSGTHREPTHGDGFENPSRTLGGGGGGGGGGTCSVGGPVGGKRASRPTPPNRPQPDDGQQPALGLMHAVPAAAVPDQPPRCRRHRRLPAGVDPGPCRGCAGAREHWQTQRAQQRAEHAAAVQAAADACLHCDEHRWRLVRPGGPPVEPAVRCDHRPVQAVPHATERPA